MGESVVVSVLPDAPAIDKEFDYLVPTKFVDAVAVGTRVRINLHGRRVGGWVTAAGAPIPTGFELKPLAGLSGMGPPKEIVDLAEWAAWRWAGRRAHFLATASPLRVVREAPARREPLTPPETPDGVRAVQSTGAFSETPRVVRVPPAADIVDWAHAAGLAGLGSGGAIVVVPGLARAAWLGRQLRSRGLPVALYPDEWALAAAGEVVIVGTRTAAWAPLARVGAGLVVDSHDEGLREERSPTWEAAVVLAERCRRDGGTAVRLSPCPTLEDLEWGRLVTLDRAEEHAGWATVEVVDRREADPRDGLLTPRVVAAARSGQRVACVINRKGHAGLLVCAACEAIAVCEVCGGSVSQTSDGQLTCRRCGVQRPPICATCASLKLKGLRPGTSRLSEHLAALVGSPVPELSAGTNPTGPNPAEAQVVVGTEAALHRAGRRDTVIFLDFDQELLAPRLRAAEQAMALLARASRLVRGRKGRVVVQTRQPDHPVLEAASQADPGLMVDSERATRRELALPPYSAVAEVSGAGAEEFVSGMPAGVAVARSAEEPPRWLVRATSHEVLCDALRAAPRPSGRLRVEVDPRRI